MRAVLIIAMLVSASAATAQDAASGSAGRSTPLRPTGQHGQVGLLRSVAADFNPAGTVQLGGHAFVSRSQGLNVPGAADTFAATLLSLEYTPAGLSFFNAPEGRAGLAFTVSTRAAATANSATSPSTVYSVGDLWLGARVGTRAGWVDLALDGALGIPSRVDGVGPERRAVAGSTLLAATLPLERLHAGVPARLHFNVGYRHNNSASLLAGYSGSVAAYTFGISRFNALPLAAGAEWPLAVGGLGVVPFVEYTRDVLLGASAGGATPQRLTPGVRILPTEALSIQLATELGLSRGRQDGVLPVAPYVFSAGVSYALGSRSRVIHVVHPGNTGLILGTVTSARTREPLAQAVVTFPKELNVPPTITDPQGRFTSPRLPPGTHTLHVDRDGFDAAQTVVTVSAKQPTQATVALVPEPERLRFGTIRGNAVDGETEKPVEIAIELPGATPERAILKDGVYELRVPPGRHRLVVSAEGYLSQGYTFDVADGDRIIRDFLMRAAPRKPSASLGKDKIEISSRLHFAFDEARLLEASFPILDEVASILLNNPHVIRVSIEGHTDNVGSVAYNQQLSEARAGAVRAYLLSKGVEESRLLSVGFGKTRPLVRKRSEAARAKNRRVEFVIDQQ